MKKTQLGLGVVIVVAAAYTAGSWFVGQRTQTLVEQSLEQTNRQLAQAFGGVAGQPRASISDYQRGVFRSTLRYTVELGAAFDTPQSVQAEIHLHHGPFPWHLLARGEVKPQMVYAEARLLPTPFVQPLLDAEARVDFAQNGSGDLTVEPILLKQSDDELRFSGGQVHLVLKNGMTDGSAEGGFASLDVLDGGTERVRVRDMRVTGQSQQSAAATQSESHFEAASVHLDLPDVGVVQIDRFGIDFAFAQAAELADYRFAYRLGATQVDGRNFGALDFGFEAKRIHLPALMGLMQVLEQADTRGTPDVDALIEHTNTLLRAQPTIALEPLRWKTDKGESHASVRADLFASEDGVELDVLFDSMGFLNYVREAKLNVEVSRAMALGVATEVAGEGNPIARSMFAMMFDQYAGQLQSAGLARIEGDKVSLSATFSNADESVELNGERMPLMDFVMLVAQLF